VPRQAVPGWRAPRSGLPFALLSLPRLVETRHLRSIGGLDALYLVRLQLKEGAAQTRRVFVQLASHSLSLKEFCRILTSTGSIFREQGRLRRSARHAPTKVEKFKKTLIEPRAEVDAPRRYPVS